ncbi:hypothetical protein O1L60_46675 [Streptomyces diastatochromogenes]|nr:hypothetical protein [Streptomyces diastatochromogenes]
MTGPLDSDLDALTATDPVPGPSRHQGAGRRVQAASVVGQVQHPGEIEHPLQRLVPLTGC